MPKSYTPQNVPNKMTRLPVAKGQSKGMDQGLPFPWLCVPICASLCKGARRGTLVFLVTSPSLPVSTHHPASECPAANSAISNWGESVWFSLTVEKPLMQGKPRGGMRRLLSSTLLLGQDCTIVRCVLVWFLSSSDCHDVCAHPHHNHQISPVQTRQGLLLR